MSVCMKMLKLSFFLFWHSTQLYKVLIKKYMYLCLAELCLGRSLQNLGAMRETLLQEGHFTCGVWDLVLYQGAEPSPLTWELRLPGKTL